jgi:glycosyltransferase involved in cell wall biosynthesis
MRLAFVTNLYPPYVVGGNEMLCEEVVNALRARGHEVAVVCGRGRDLPARPDMHGVLPLDLDRKAETFLGGRVPGTVEAFRWHVFDGAAYRATRQALGRADPEVVVVWNLYLASLGPLVAARRHGPPVVTHVCDKWLYFSLADAGPVLNLDPWGKRRVLLAQRLARPLLRRALLPLRVVAISEFMRRFYLDAGFPAEDVQTIRLGVPLQEFAYRERPPRPPGSPLRLLYVGGLWEGKGPQTAVRALGRLKREGLRALHLDVCGSGTPAFLEWLRGVIAEEDVAEAVTLHGFVQRRVVRDFCQSHDLLLFPSQWDEPFAAVPVEAMSTGMAVVATTAGGTPEAITDGKTGLLVPPGDAAALAAAVRRLVEDDGLRLRLGAAAARAARERFSFDHYIDGLEESYRLLLPPRRPPV